MRQAFCLKNLHLHAKKEQMTFFRQFLHAKANFTYRKYVSMSTENSNLHAKLHKLILAAELILCNLFCEFRA